jgi:lysophospholipase L1-like esterase
MSIASLCVRQSRSFCAYAFFACCCAAVGQIPTPGQATTPTDNLRAGWWAARHQEVLQQVRAHPDAQLILIGDSITDNYVGAQPPDQNFQPIWDQFYAARGAFNLGFSGDTTANVLWRLNHGEVDGLHPKVALVLLGTKNTGYMDQSAAETGLGIDAVVADLEERLPGTHILLLGILPSESSVEKSLKDEVVNRYLATDYGENPRVTYLDVGSIFRQDGKLKAGLFYDPRLPHPGKPLHPDTQGQRMMAEAIEPTLATLMQDAPAVPLNSMTDINTALLPVPWLEQDSYDWYARHHAELAIQKDMLANHVEPVTVMVGDSITNFWGGEPIAVRASGREAWARLFGKTPTVNMGFGWDRTQNVLWRLRQGELADLHPRNIVVNIGTNNLTGTSHARTNTPGETAAGVEAICEMIHAQTPKSRIFLMAIFPRGTLPNNPLRQSIDATNGILAPWAAGQSWIGYVDMGRRFLHADGSLNRDLLPDGTHPSNAGYQLWADALSQAGFDTSAR